jgi:hypothetical protein
MSKRWLSPPLTLLSTNGDEHSNNLDGHAWPSNVDSIQPASSGSGFSSPHDSETQYAIAGLPDHYMDLPSAVPFQDALTPALPSAEFPTSARGFMSPLGTFSTTDFTSASVHPSTNQTASPESKRQSNPSIHSELTVHAPSSHRIIISGPSGATAPADSSVSHDSVWSGEGSNQHFTLDITQFPGPPDSPSDDQSSLAPASSILGSLHSLRKPKQLRPPASPLYEESEPSASRPSSLDPTTLPGLNLQPSPQNDAPLDPRQASKSTSLPATSVRGSFVSHLTAASRGSSSPRLSITEDRAQTSILEGPEPTWDHVMSSVNQNWNSSRSVANRASALPSSVPSTAVIGASSSDQDERNILVVPTRPFASIRTPISGGESGNSIYSAIGRFPRPPGSVGGDELSPISQGTPRTPWITGLTLNTRNTHGSLGRQGSLKSSMKSPLATPAIPSSAASIKPNVSSLEPSPIKRHDEVANSSRKESKVDSPGLEVLAESRSDAPSRSSG